MHDRLNAVFARMKINSAPQSHRTDGEIGYVVLEAMAIFEEIRRIEGVILAGPPTYLSN